LQRKTGSLATQNNYARNLHVFSLQFKSYFLG
jgi:hypothetical protein